MKYYYLSSEKSSLETGDNQKLGLSQEFGINRYTLLYIKWASLVAQLVKNPSAMQETWVQSLHWEDPLQKGSFPLRYSGLENSMDCIVYGVTKSQT